MRWGRVETTSREKCQPLELGMGGGGGGLAEGRGKASPNNGGSEHCGSNQLSTERQW